MVVYQSLLAYRALIPTVPTKWYVQEDSQQQDYLDALFLWKRYHKFHQQGWKLWLDLPSQQRHVLEEYMVSFPWMDGTHTFPIPFKESEELCSICVARLNQGFVLKCGHVFHISCLHATVKGLSHGISPDIPIIPKCPYCRQVMKW